MCHFLICHQKSQQPVDFFQSIGNKSYTNDMLPALSRCGAGIIVSMVGVMEDTFLACQFISCRLRVVLGSVTIDVALGSATSMTKPPAPTTPVNTPMFVGCEARRRG